MEPIPVTGLHAGTYMKHLALRAILTFTISMLIRMAAFLLTL